MGNLLNPFGLLLLLQLALWLNVRAAPNPKPTDFWRSGPHKGANVFNKNVPSDLIEAAHQYQIDFIRLAPDKFPTKESDFLIGNVDNYQGLVSEDLSVLKILLDSFHQKNLPVVLTMLSLPGSRWKQNNNCSDDLRLWTRQDFQGQAAQFWQDLARELKDHPAVVGYNILNEPHLDRLYNSGSVTNESDHEIDHDQVQMTLFNFYDNVTRSIRQVDQNTSIILDSSDYANPKTFEKLKPVNDSNIFYSFHMYEPYVYTDRRLNLGRYFYPGNIPTCVVEENKLEFWNKSMIIAHFEPVRKFQKKHKIPSNKILVGEFGGHRTSSGLEIYFRDLISIFNEYKWSWAVYAFREDTWDGMDYELGSKKLSWNDQQGIENGTKEKEYLPNNPIFTVLKDEWISSVK